MVAHLDGELGIFGAVELGQLAVGDDLHAPGLGVGAGGDQGHLAVVVHKAHARQLFMGDQAAGGDGVEVAQVEVMGRERGGELHHHGFVFGFDGANLHRVAVYQGEGAHILHRIGADGRPRQLGVGDAWVVEDDARIQGDDLVG